MKHIVTIKFKDGHVIVREPVVSTKFGLLEFFYDDLYFNPVSGTLYKGKDSILCAEDITDQVREIEINMKY